MFKIERKINYSVELEGKPKKNHESWTGIQINCWPLVHTCSMLLTWVTYRPPQFT